MQNNLDLAKFNPRRLAYFEKENYVAYYRRQWLRLLVASVSMVKEAYQLSLPQAVYAAYLVARAEMAAAPFPNNDIPKAEAYMGRLYRFLKNIYPLQFDVEDAAHREVNWWVVHRNLFAQDQNQEVIAALADSNAAFFGKPAEVFMPAAVQRGKGILFSDKWVRSGMPTYSTLLLEEEDALCEGYSLLRDALMSKV